MTREETIRELKQFSGTTRLRLSANFWEALNRAIKLLERDSREDAISRRAVLDTLDKMDSVLDEDRTVETYKELLVACYNDLPPVTPVHKKEWIPCSVKMPKPDEFVNNVRKYYLVQNEYGDMCVATYTNKGWRPINTLYVLEDIVVWRQLPEQYKAEAEKSSRKYAVEVCNKFHNYRDQIGVFSTCDEAKVFADKKDFDFDESSEYVEITEVEGGNA